MCLYPSEQGCIEENYMAPQELYFHIPRLYTTLGNLRRTIILKQVFWKLRYGGTKFARITSI